MNTELLLDETHLNVVQRALKVRTFNKVHLWGELDWVSQLHPSMLIKQDLVKAISLSVVVSNKAKGRISNWVFQENKARQIFQKNERFLPLHTHFCLITDELDKIRKAFSSKSNLSQCSVGSTIFPLWTAPEVNDEEGSHASRFYRWFF